MKNNKIKRLKHFLCDKKLKKTPKTTLNCHILFSLY